MVNISFVIPAFNEEALIARMLERVHRHGGKCGRYEIIVADHGSTDRTVALAEAGGARVTQPTAKTIGELRNEGARLARGKLLVFLDADVFLTEGWSRAIPEVFRFLEAHPETVTGSWIGLPPQPAWIERWWFGPLVHRCNTHINSGHLIVWKRYFHELGGFDPTYETGEDYEFSKRTEAMGGNVVENPRLHVEHHGFPKSVCEFIRREAWHGLADFKSLSRLLKSKVALLTCAFVALHAAAAVALSLNELRVAAGAFAAVVATCAAASGAKYGIRHPVVTLVNAALYYVYFVGRSLSLYRSLRLQGAARHQRAEAG